MVSGVERRPGKTRKIPIDEGQITVIECHFDSLATDIEGDTGDTLISRHIGFVIAEWNTIDRDILKRQSCGATANADIWREPQPLAMTARANHVAPLTQQTNQTLR